MTSYTQAARMAAVAASALHTPEQEQRQQHTRMVLEMLGCNRQESQEIIDLVRKATDEAFEAITRTADLGSTAQTRLLTVYCSFIAVANLCSQCKEEFGKMLEKQFRDTEGKSR